MTWGRLNSNFKLAILENKCFNLNEKKKKKKIFAVRVWMIPFRSVRPLHLGLVFRLQVSAIAPTGY